MKNLNLAKIWFAAFALIIVLTFFMGCSEDNIFNPTSSNQTVYETDMPDSNVTVTTSWDGSFLVFAITNNLPSYINDFHVQFDSTVKITGWSIPPGWMIDPNSTDTAHGRIGVRVQNGQPIQPGQELNRVIGVQLKYTGISKKKPSQWWDFTWQATRDGVVVFAGRDALPRR